MKKALFILLGLMPMLAYAAGWEWCKDQQCLVPVKFDTYKLCYHYQATQQGGAGFCREAAK